MILKELFNSSSDYSYLFINQINNRNSLIVGNKIVLYIDNTSLETLEDGDSRKRR